MKHMISTLDLKNDETQNSDQNTSTMSKVKPISVNTQDAKILVEILQIPTDQRKSDHIQIMKECLRKVKFLQSYQDSPHYGEVLRNLELENLPLDHILFRQGDAADRFYIILNGIIGLYIRTQNDAETVPKKELVSPRDNHQMKSPRQQGDLTKSPNKNDSPTKMARRSIISNAKQDENQSTNILGVGVREVARLESGDAFGELGLLFNENRTATAVCLDTTSLLVLKKEVFEKYLSQSKNAKISVMVDFYTNLWQMREMKQKEILKLATKTTLTQCSKNTIIIKQGEKPKGIFFVRNGIVKLISTLKFRVDPITFNILDDYNDPSAEESRQKRFKTIDVQLEEIGNGNLFGDYEVFNNKDIPYTAVTTTDCDILTITLQDLKSCITSDVFKHFSNSIKHYPSSEKIKRQYIENIMWNNYKNDIVKSFNNELVNSIRQANIFSHRLPFLPKVTLSKYQIYDEVSSFSNLKDSDKNKRYDQNSPSSNKNNDDMAQKTDNSLQTERNTYSKAAIIQAAKSKRRQSVDSPNEILKSDIKDQKTSLFGELSKLNRLERQEDYLKSLILKQTDKLQNKTKGVQNVGYYDNIDTHKIKNQSPMKNKQQKKKEGNMQSSRSATQLLNKDKLVDAKQVQAQQNQSLFLQNKLIDDILQDHGLEDTKKLTSHFKNNSHSSSKYLAQSLKSNKFILPKINKQSKVSLLANEIY